MDQLDQADSESPGLPPARARALRPAPASVSAVVLPRGRHQVAVGSLTLASFNSQLEKSQLRPRPRVRADPRLGHPAPAGLSTLASNQGKPETGGPGQPAARPAQPTAQRASSRFQPPPARRPEMASKAREKSGKKSGKGPGKVQGNRRRRETSFRRTGPGRLFFQTEGPSRGDGGRGRGAAARRPPARGRAGPRRRHRVRVTSRGGALYTANQVGTRSPDRLLASGPEFRAVGLGVQTRRGRD